MLFSVLCDRICGVRRHVQRDSHVRAHQASKPQQPCLSKHLPQDPHPRPRRPEGHVSPAYKQPLTHASTHPSTLLP